MDRHGVADSRHNGRRLGLHSHKRDLDHGRSDLSEPTYFTRRSPAISVGLSVSRVGSAAQIKAIKQVAGK